MGTGLYTNRREIGTGIGRSGNRQFTDKRQIKTYTLKLAETAEHFVNFFKYSFFNTFSSKHAENRFEEYLLVQCTVPTANSALTASSYFSQSFFVIKSPWQFGNVALHTLVHTWCTPQCTPGAHMVHTW